METNFRCTSSKPRPFALPADTSMAEGPLPFLRARAERRKRTRECVCASVRTNSPAKVRASLLASKRVYAQNV
eukprot:6209679-Pleurochrysis_carterae.AAC.2